MSDRLRILFYLLLREWLIYFILHIFDFPKRRHNSSMSDDDMRSNDTPKPIQLCLFQWYTFISLFDEVLMFGIICSILCVCREQSRMRFYIGLVLWLKLRKINGSWCHCKFSWIFILILCGFPINRFEYPVTEHMVVLLFSCP